MNYKKIFKSKNARLKLLAALSWIPDSIMVPLQYRIHTGRKLSLKNPNRFTEKLQIYKLKYRNLAMLRCTDKFEVRSFVEEQGLKDILIPMYGIYDSEDEVDFEKLPNEFVAKTTDGSGGNEIFICRNKSEVNKEEFMRKLQDWMSMPKRKPAGREWAYENGFPRRIVIEKLIKTDTKKKDLPDYKFYCFNSKPAYCQFIDNRSTEETIDFYDMDWNHQEFVGLNPKCKNSGVVIPRPENFDLMKKIAAKLSADYPFVRVDLYDVGNTVYFGELTFYPASGYGNFNPDEYDYRLGHCFDCTSFM